MCVCVCVCAGSHERGRGESASCTTSWRRMSEAVKSGRKLMVMVRGTDGSSVMASGVRQGREGWWWWWGWVGVGVGKHNE